MAKERSVNWRMMGVICTVVVTLIGAFTFLVNWNLRQGEETAGLTTDVSVLENSYGEHVKHSAEVFRKIDGTLTKQQEVITKTREAMIKISAAQTAIKEENGRLARSVEKLAEEIRKANGGSE